MNHGLSMQKLYTYNWQSGQFRILPKRYLPDPDDTLMFWDTEFSAIRVITPLSSILVRNMDQARTIALSYRYGRMAKASGKPTDYEYFVDCYRLRLMNCDVEGNLIPPIASEGIVAPI